MALFQEANAVLSPPYLRFLLCHPRINAGRKKGAPSVSFTTTMAQKKAQEWHVYFLKDSQKYKVL